MGFREVSVVEVREVLRAWLQGAGLRKAAERAGVDRKTARRYVAAAEAAGLVRDVGVGAVTDELVGQVVDAVRPARPDGHGGSWELLLAHEEQIRAWVKGGDGRDPLSVVKMEELLARRGVRVPYRTLHRFAVAQCGFRVRPGTVRVADGAPGVECQLDFAQLGLLVDPQTGKARRVHALIFTAVLSRHMFVWLTYSQTLPAVIAGCEAAWAFYGGCFQVLIPDNMKAVVTNADAVNPQLSTGWLDYAQHVGFATDPARVRSPQDKPRVERAVQYVRGNFWAGECFTDLADAQARVEAWCRQRAGMRIHGTTARRPVEMFTELESGCLLPVPDPVRRAGVHPGQGAPRLPRRDRQGVVLGARTPARGAPGRPCRLRAGHAVHHRRARRGPAGQDPPAPTARRAVHRPGRPARAQGRLRAARPVPADHRLRRARAAHRHLRRAAVGRAAAVDADARRIPAARAGPPLRPRPGGGRLRTVPGPGRRVRVQDRLDARESPRTRTADPARRRRLHPHNTQGGRFARTPSEYGPTNNMGHGGVQLSLIPGGTNPSAATTTPEEHS